ncbi:CdaR family transcriptional regulator [Caldicellulosiruptor changbaiensis]|uniref:CdaR family transcriptional regulator n=1 Tax=Caldicellulosiruptor changbaiensis TaxID=1222016 RepID=A0A3T0D6W9_9FIRM|nr:helix-turn-helix domain-containing protein [Caldicellulosiruptor changbaiensis]AZT90803.1 CdaR family transcriptional regulator [Caldicellulosiruptor changbaiensis]
MMTQKVIDVLEQAKDIIEDEFGYIEADGRVVYSSNPLSQNRINTVAIDMIKTDTDLEIFEGRTYKVFRTQTDTYVLYINNTEPHAEKLLDMLNLVVMKAKEPASAYDKKLFIKNLLYDNILPGEIYTKARELHIATGATRVVFAIYIPNAKEIKDINVGEILTSIFPKSTKDFIIQLDNNILVFIKELKPGSTDEDAYKVARIILDTLNSELLLKAYIGIGSVVDDIKELSMSYKEAEAALKIGYIFEKDKYIVSYHKLGLGRLIYQMPTKLCEMFLEEVFKDVKLSDFDPELIQTVEMFFECNLNVSETARQLYIHRNTLVYRLDKIERMIGLDLRKFEDAIIFKMAMLVNQYLEYTKGNITF